MYNISKKSTRWYFHDSKWTLGKIKITPFPSWRWVNSRQCFHKILVHTRSSHRRCSVKKKCSENFRKFYRKTPVLESLFNKFAGVRPATLLKRLQHRCFSVKFVKFLRTPFCRTSANGCFSHTSIFKQFLPSNNFCPFTLMKNLEQTSLVVAMIKFYY